MTLRTAVSAEQLFDMGDIGRCDLLDGEIIMMAPAGAEHGDISLRLGAMIHQFVEANNFGNVHAAETGFLIARNPDTVRAPDVAFVRSMSIMPANHRSIMRPAKC